MDKPSYIRNFGMKAWVILVELLLLVSCDNAIYDDEGDCFSDLSSEISL